MLFGNNIVDGDVVYKHLKPYYPFVEVKHGQKRLVLGDSVIYIGIINVNIGFKG